MKLWSVEPALHAHHWEIQQKACFEGSGLTKGLEFCSFFVHVYLRVHACVYIFFGVLHIFLEDNHTVPHLTFYIGSDN